MPVFPLVDIPRAAAAWRTLRVLAAGLLVLGLFAVQAAPRANQGEAAWISSAPADAAEPAKALRVGSAAYPGLDMDESSEDAFKLGRAVKMPPTDQPGEAHLRPRDRRAHAGAAALPERPPRA